MREGEAVDEVFAVGIGPAVPGEERRGGERREVLERVVVRPEGPRTATFELGLLRTRIGVVHTLGPLGLGFEDEHAGDVDEAVGGEDGGDGEVHGREHASRRSDEDGYAASRPNDGFRFAPAVAVCGGLLPRAAKEARKPDRERRDDAGDQLDGDEQQRARGQPSRQPIWASSAQTGRAHELLDRVSERAERARRFSAGSPPFRYNPEMGTLPAALPILGSLVGSSYRIVAPLGAGGMGLVYRAARGGDERFAVKIVSFTPSDEDGRRRFLREARIASRLKSPHLVPVLESGIDRAAGWGFLAMPAIEGGDLASLVERVGALPPRAAATIAFEAATGLCVAHAAGVIHRDLKPANVLLSVEGERITTTVADFGIAKDWQGIDSLTATGASMGSPAYMAPEQLSNAKNAGARADVWGLAMTLYEALAGRGAFADVSSVAEMCLLARDGKIPPLQDVAPWVPADLATIVHDGLKPDPLERCPSMHVFRDALAGFLGGEPTLSRDDLRALSDEERAVVAPRAAAGATLWDVLPPARDKTVDADDPLVGQTLGGAFELLRKIGQGGMGAVYEAVDRAGTRAAVKVVKNAAADADSLRRFVREGRATRRVQSPHVVAVLAADEGREGPPFLAMELLDGLDLDTLIKRLGALEPSAVARVFVQAARGLEAAHASGIVHRDVKPANLFLHELAGGSLCTKVCDFGVAKSIDLAPDADTTLDLTRTGGMLGSPMYLSPEQARSAKTVGPATDIWSLALSLYEALSGQRAWAGCHSMGELIVAICTSDVPPLQDVAPWIGPELSAVVHRGLRREADQRWPSMAAFADALEPFAAPGDVTEADLSKLTDTARATRAPRETPAASSAAMSVSLASVSSANPATLPTKRRGPWGPVAVVLAALVAAASVRRLQDGTAPSALAVPASSASGWMVAASAAPPAPALSSVGAAQPGVSTSASAPAAPATSPSPSPSTSTKLPLPKASPRASAPTTTGTAKVDPAQTAAPLPKLHGDL